VFIESTITHPADIVIEHGDSVRVTWHANGTLPESHKTFINGELASYGVWDGSPYWTEFGGLSVGEHIIGVTLYFTSRMSVSDNVTVTVQSASGPNIILSQASGSAGESVEVSAEISDTCGISEVVLSYSVDSYTWINVTMSESGTQWNGTIPGQAADTIVGYKVFAWDNLGNEAVSPSKSYTVVIEPRSYTPPMTLYLIAGAGVASVVVVGLVVMKRR